MIFERRAYTLDPGHVPAFDKAQVDRGFEIAKPYMDRLVGYFSTATGPVDQVVHVYRYDTLEDWNQRLRGMYKVPEMLPYFTSVRKFVRHQVNAFYDLLPVPELNPLWGEGRDWLPGGGATLARRTDGTLIEERAFQMRPGGVPAFVEACKAHGIKALRAMDGRTVGAFVTAIGVQHHVLLWWWFENAAEREARTAELAASPDWQAFVAATAPVVVGQDTLLLRPRPVPEMSPLFS
jgi:hypothetical protein